MKMSLTEKYYYRVRYLDPRTSRWLSADPALTDYIPLAPVNDEAKKHNQNLPGMGGIYNTVNFHLYHYAGNNPVKYIDPDGKELSLGYGWVGFCTCGWNDNAPQTVAGYHEWMDSASIALFNIQHAEVNMGDYMIRFWKGDYGSIARLASRMNVKTMPLAFLIGMAGGETGLYNNDGKGLGNSGGSLMSAENLASIGIINVGLDVKTQDGKTIASVRGNRAWPNAYNILNHSKKNNLYTETTFTFTNTNAASTFKTQFRKGVENGKYADQFKINQNDKVITITWGNINE